MRIIIVPCFVLLLAACGGGASDETTSNDTTGSEDPGEDQVCEGYSPTDACMSDDNFAQCQQMASQCPGEVQAMESCPLQFSCP